MLGKYIANVRNVMPMIHSITNHVNINDVANIVLACSGSPMMSDEPAEVEDITAFCDGLCINIRDLSTKSTDAAFLAGRQSNLLGHVVVLEPDSAGENEISLKTAVKLMDELTLDVLCGNLSEIQKLAQEEGILPKECIENETSDENLDEMIAMLNEFSRVWKCIIAVTGNVDLVSDGRKCYVIENGMMQVNRIPTRGCLLAAMITAFLVSNPGHELEAAAAAVCTMDYAGQIAWGRMETKDNIETDYKNRMINAVYQMQEEILDAGEHFIIKSEIR